MILLLFVLSTTSHLPPPPNYPGTCLVFTAPSISPPHEFGPEQLVPLAHGGNGDQLCCGMEDVEVSLPRWAWWPSAPAG